MEIRKLSENDLEARVAFLNDPRITDFIHLNGHIDIEGTRKWYQIIKNNNKRVDFSFMHENKIVGMGGLSDISDMDEHASLYIYMSPEFHGKGLGTQALKLLCSYGFNILNLRRIYLYTFVTNEVANHLYEKVGFVREGVLRKHTKKNGELVDRYFWGLLKEEFKV
jgi:UDP-4-amino-4,6-dideoxy-N-acetyl-beta-L-altrosamine N-acetyltransferase